MLQKLTMIKLPSQSPSIQSLPSPSLRPQAANIASSNNSPVAPTLSPLSFRNFGNSNSVFALNAKTSSTKGSNQAAWSNAGVAPKV